MSEKQPQTVRGAWALAAPSEGDPGELANLRAGGLVNYRANLKVRGRHLVVETTWSFAGVRMEPVAVRVISGEYPPKPVLGDVIRAIPFGSLNQEARADAEAKRSDPIFKALTKMHPAMDAAFGPLQTEAARLGPRRGQQLTEEELAEIAAVYRAAYARGESVRRAVKDHFHISESTASKRIMKAKAAGLLDDIQRGR